MKGVTSGTIIQGFLTLSILLLTIGFARLWKIKTILKIYFFVLLLKCSELYLDKKVIHLGSRKVPGTKLFSINFSALEHLLIPTKIITEI